MRRWRYIISAGAILVLLGMMVARPSGLTGFWNPAPDRLEGDADGTRADGTSAGPVLTKRSVRDMRRKPTVEETLDLLKTTTVPLVDLEDESMEKTASLLNKFAGEQGIPARALTISIDTRIAHLRIRELKVRNAPLSLILKYICDNTVIRYKVSEGRVLLGLHDSFPEEPAPARTEPADPDNPFSDPFAE